MRDKDESQEQRDALSKLLRGSARSQKQFRNDVIEKLKSAGKNEFPSVRSVSSWFRGEYLPSLPFRKVVAQALGSTDFDQLIGSSSVSSEKDGVIETTVLELSSLHEYLKDKIKVTQESGTLIKVQISGFFVANFFTDKDAEIIKVKPKGVIETLQVCFQVSDSSPKGQLGLIRKSTLGWQSGRTLDHLSQIVKSVPNVDVRLTTNFSNFSLLRHDDRMYVIEQSIEEAGERYHLIELIKNVDGGLFDQYVNQFERIFECATPFVPDSDYRGVEILANVKTKTHLAAQLSEIEAAYPDCSYSEMRYLTKELLKEVNHSRVSVLEVVGSAAVAAFSGQDFNPEMIFDDDNLSEIRVLVQDPHILIQNELKQSQTKVDLDYRDRMHRLTLRSLYGLANLSDGALDYDIRYSNAQLGNSMIRIDDVMLVMIHPYSARNPNMGNFQFESGPVVRIHKLLDYGLFQTFASGLDELFNCADRISRIDLWNCIVKFSDFLNTGS